MRKSLKQIVEMEVKKRNKNRGIKNIKEAAAR